MLGNPGQLTRPRIPYEDLEHEPPDLPEWRPALPAGCLRRLSSPRPDECNSLCEGKQRDGSCLCEIVRAANAAGIKWSFEIDKDLFWTYIGPEIPEQAGGAEVAPAVAAVEPGPTVKVIFDDQPEPEA